MELEKKVLSLLEYDAKLSSRTIAIMLDESEDTIIDIIKRLEHDKTIIGYSTVINWDKAGGDGVTAIIDVKVTPQRDVGFNSIADRIARFPEVKNVYLMSGLYDLSVMVTGETMKEIASFVSYKLSTLESVESTVSHFILKRYKQDNFVFEEPTEDKRLVVSP
ncbi:MAG: Lrp/AsnC family transcriptional regulator [Syntrophomonas sp.]